MDCYVRCHPSDLLFLGHDFSDRIDSSNLLTDLETMKNLGALSGNAWLRKQESFHFAFSFMSGVLLDAVCLPGQFFHFVSSFFVASSHRSFYLWGDKGGKSIFRPCPSKAVQIFPAKCTSRSFAKPDSLNLAWYFAPNLNCKYFPLLARIPNILMYICTYPAQLVDK